MKVLKITAVLTVLIVLLQMRTNAQVKNYEADWKTVEDHIKRATGFCFGNCKENICQGKNGKAGCPAGKSYRLHDPTTAGKPGGKSCSAY